MVLEDPIERRIPTLVQLCQRVACINVENICSLGQDLREDLIKPVLESCTPDTLLRFEQADSYVSRWTTDIWKELFWREHPIEAHQYEVKAKEEPESWRDELFLLRESKRQRFDQLSVRLKASRQEEEERKRESAIKLTDKIPPAKRTRTWGAPSQQRTLFQKTKSETARLQKGVFGSHNVRPTFQKQRIITSTASARPPPPPASSGAPSSSRVVVRSVPVRQTPNRPPQATPKPAVVVKPNVPPISAQRTVSSPPTASSPPPQSSPPPEAHSPIARVPKKKQEASLFMPKHRAYSQVPRALQSKP